MSEVVPRQGLISIGWKLSILEPSKNGHFIFSWGHVGDNIRCYPLSICVCGRKSLYALALRVAKQEFNVIIVSCRSVSDPNFLQWWNKLWMNKARALLYKTAKYWSCASSFMSIDRKYSKWQNLLKESSWSSSSLTDKKCWNYCRLNIKHR